MTKVRGFNQIHISYGGKLLCNNDEVVQIGSGLVQDLSCMDNLYFFSTGQCWRTDGDSKSSRRPNPDERKDLKHDD